MGAGVRSVALPRLRGNADSGGEIPPNKFAILGRCRKSLHCRLSRRLCRTDRVRLSRLSRLQCENMPRAADRPGEVAAAIRLAQLLDDPAYFALAAQNSYKLHTLLTSLGAPKKKARSRLAAVSAMTERKRAAQ